MTHNQPAQQQPEDKSDLPILTVHKPGDPPIEKKWHIPSWMMRDPGPRVRKGYNA